jgi:hypothetical protein
LVRGQFRRRDLPGSGAKGFVALTCRRLHRLAIQYLYVTTIIIDYRRGFEFVRNLRHGSSPNPKHFGKKLLRQSDIVAIDPVGSLQDPASGEVCAILLTLKKFRYGTAFVKTN